MNYIEFTQRALEATRGALGEDISVELRDVQKNNGVRLKGLVIRDPGANLSPTIYLDEFYKKYRFGASMDEIVDDILNVYDMSKITGDMDTSIITDFEKASEYISLKLINTSRNDNMFSRVPNIPFLDLSIVFYLLIDDCNGQTGSILINNDQMNSWETDAEALFRISLANASKLFTPRLSTLMNLTGDLLDKSPSPHSVAPQSMYILTNARELFGASVMLYPGMMSRVRAFLGEDFYILPSSIHEVIIVPESFAPSKKHMNDMINEVNTIEVSPEEVLSDHYYFYSIDEGRVTCAAA
ncbi:MAG: DUF5688 family protein [Eubacterium sp.]|nr:DUF5688 family protein [Eubacterium sp.]